MKITFIRPNMGSQKSKDAMQPLAFAVLAAYTPDNIELELFDDRIEEIDFNTKTNLVAISVETFTAKRAYQISAKFRSRGIPVIMGGFHATAMPQEILQFADSVAIGDGETTWPEIVLDLQNGNLKPVYQAIALESILNTKFDRAIFHNKKYVQIEMVQWARGCPHSCDFCSINSYFNGNQYYRPIDDVVLELKNFRNKTIFFVDDNLYHNKQLFRQFLEAIIPLKLKWACQISMDITHDAELLKLMKLSGCIAVIVGIETLSVDNLQLMNKKWNQDEKGISESITKFRQFGIMIYGSFVFGYNYDTMESFKKALDFALKSKFFISNFNPLYPMPGTKLFDKLKDENRLIYPQWWLDDDYYYGKALFKPQNLSESELENLVFQTKQKFNSLHSIFIRSLDYQANMVSFRNFAMFWMVNLTNRNEIYKKQGVKLGGLE